MSLRSIWVWLALASTAHAGGLAVFEPRVVGMGEARAARISAELFASINAYEPSGVLRPERGPDPAGAARSAGAERYLQTRVERHGDWCDLYASLDDVDGIGGMQVRLTVRASDAEAAVETLVHEALTRPQVTSAPLPEARASEASSAGRARVARRIVRVGQALGGRGFRLGQHFLTMSDLGFEGGAEISLGGSDEDVGGVMGIHLAFRRRFGLSRFLEPSLAAGLRPEFALRANEAGLSGLLEAGLRVGFVRVDLQFSHAVAGAAGGGPTVMFGVIL